MRIAVIGPVYPYRGGIAHYTSMLAVALAERHEVCVISFRRQFPRWLYPGRSDRDPSRMPMRVEAEYLLEPLNPLTWWQTGRWIKRRRPDLVIFQWWVTFWAPAFATVASLARRADVPVMFMIHNVLPHEERGWDGALARLALRHGERFIAHTPLERQRLLSLVPQARVEVCPFPAYDMLAGSRVSRATARERLGLPENIPILLFFGIVRPYKGLDQLFEALALLRDRGRVVHLVVAGEFWVDQSEYVRQIQRLRLSALVRLEDRYIPDEEVGLFFSAADALVAPYVDGTQSAAAAMALGFGLPLIVTETIAAAIAPTNRQYVSVVPPGDSPALAAAIETFFATPTPPAVPSPEPDPRGWQRLVGVIEESMM